MSNLIELSNEEVLAIPIDHLGAIILRHLKETDQWSEHNFTNQSQNQGIPDNVLCVWAEGLSWLISRRLVSRGRPGNNNSASTIFLITTQRKHYLGWHDIVQPIDNKKKIMPRNAVQFQKGLSLTNFLKDYGTEKQCYDALFSWRWNDGFRCPKCGHNKYCELNARKLQQCHRCHCQTSVIAGTIFESTKLPLTTWFLGMYLITQTKKGISAMQLHRQLGISYNAVWRIKHKLMQVMMERDDDHPLSGFVEVDDAYLGGE